MAEEKDAQRECKDGDNVPKYKRLQMCPSPMPIRIPVLIPLEPFNRLEPEKRELE